MSGYKGKLAFCSQGKLGIITEDEAQEVTYPDGNKGVAFVGVCLETGEPWSSRQPAILGTIQEIAESNLSLRDFIKKAQPLLTPGFVHAPYIPFYREPNVPLEEDQGPTTVRNVLSGETKTFDLGPRRAVFAAERESGKPEPSVPIPIYRDGKVRCGDWEASAEPLIKEEPSEA